MVSKTRDITTARGQSICVFLLHGNHGQTSLRIRCGGTSHRSSWWNLPWSRAQQLRKPLTSWLREISPSWTMRKKPWLAMYGKHWLITVSMTDHSSSSLTIIDHSIYYYLFKRRSLCVFLVYSSWDCHRPAIMINSNWWPWLMNHMILLLPHNGCLAVITIGRYIITTVVVWSFATTLICGIINRISWRLLSWLHVHHCSFYNLPLKRLMDNVSWYYHYHLLSTTQDHPWLLYKLVAQGSLKPMGLLIQQAV